MTAYKRYLELIFPKHVGKNDIEIIEAATYDEPGRARLKAAKTQETHSPGIDRLLSVNSGQLIGLVGPARLVEPPFISCYWIEEESNGKP